MQLRRAGGGRHRQRGFTLIEVLIVVAIIGILSAMATPALRASLLRARTKALAADGRALLTAFKAYSVDHEGYPPCCSPADEALDLTTLEPLTTGGYLQNGLGITRKLEGGAIGVYDSPDTNGLNQEVYALLTHRLDPNIVVVVAHTDELPGFEGEALDGVYFIRDGEIRRADQ